MWAVCDVYAHDRGSKKEEGEWRKEKKEKKKNHQQIENFFQEK